MQTKTIRHPVLRNVVMLDVPRALPRPGWLTENSGKGVLSPAMAASPVHTVVDALQTQQAAHLRADGRSESRSPMHGERFADEEANRVARAEGLKQGLADAEEQIAAATQKAESELTERLNMEYASEKATLQAAERLRMQQLDRLLAQFADESCKRLAALQEDAVALAFEALCRLLGERFSDRALLSEGISHAIASLRGQPILRVKLNSRDKHRLEADAPGRTLMERHAHVQWIAEDSIAAGEFVIDGMHGSLDVRLTDQVERLRALWLEIVGGTAGCSPDNQI